MRHPSILLFRGEGWISRLIRWQSNGHYSHAAVDCGDQSLIEASAVHGVWTRRIPESRRGIDSFEVEGLTKEQGKAVLEFLNDRIGKPYDFGGVARFLTRWRKDQDHKWFCSELVFEAFRHAGVNLLERCTAAQVSPTVLSFSPRLKPTT